MKKVIFQKGHYTSRSACPKCPRKDNQLMRWCTDGTYDEKHDALDYYCWNCFFKFSEYVDSEKGQDYNVQNIDNDKNILIDNKWEEINILIEELKSNEKKYNQLYEMVYAQNEKIIKLEEKIKQIVDNQSLFEKNRDNEVSLDDLDNFKI